jgi:hypothetical protein
MSDHHSRCQKALAWDIPNVPCTCPRGWPRKAVAPRTPEPTPASACECQCCPHDGSACACACHDSHQPAEPERDRSRLPAGETQLDRIEAMLKRIVRTLPKEVDYLPINRNRRPSEGDAK